MKFTKEAGILIILGILAVGALSLTGACLLTDRNVPDSLIGITAGVVGGLLGALRLGNPNNNG